MRRVLFLVAIAAGALLALPVRALSDAPRGDEFARTGIFKALVADDFAAGRAENIYQLETDDGEVLTLRFAVPPSARTGDRVSITGWPGRGAFEVEDIQPVGPGRAAMGRAALSAWTTGAKRVLVILVNFTNDSSFDATTVANAQTLYFGVGTSVARYFAEASFGLTSMSGDVVLVTATVPKPATCDTGTIQSQANARALAAGFNPSNYAFPVWIFPAVGACGWNGLGYVGGGGSWINGTGSMSLLVAGHELGHNFGVNHAHSYACPGNVTIAPSGCTRSDYGDQFDIMGNSRAGHFNAYSKSVFGWLPGGGITNHMGGSATYTLGAIEAAAQFPYAVRIPTTKADRTYLVEWRSRAGFDSVEPATLSNGALVRLAPSAAGGTDLLDMQPATTAFGDAQLNVGQTFTDPELGLTIKTLAKTATSLTIEVDYGAAPPATAFHTLAPCRVFDTRGASGTYGGPVLFAGQARSWPIRGRCGIPATATAIAGNITVAGPTAAGWIRVVPAGAPSTGSTSVSFRAGQTRANNVTSALGATGNLVVDGLPSGTAHVILDVVGWFE